MYTLLKRQMNFADYDRNDEAGFTLVELLVVMVILVLLAGFVGPKVVGYLSSSKIKTAKIQIEGLTTSLELFKLDTGRYPNSQEGLEALIKQPTTISTWNGPYLTKRKVPKDPWGNPYTYKQPGEKAEFDIISLGADGKSGGDGENRDVTNSDE